MNTHTHTHTHTHTLYLNISMSSLSVFQRQSSRSLELSVHADPSALLSCLLFVLFVLKPLWSTRTSFMPIDFQWQWSGPELDAPFKKAVQAFHWGANATATQHDEWTKVKRKEGKVGGEKKLEKKLEPVQQDGNTFSLCDWRWFRRMFLCIVQTHWPHCIFPWLQSLFGTACYARLLSLSYCAHVAFPAQTTWLWAFISSVAAILQSQHSFTATHLCFCLIWTHGLIATNPKQISHVFWQKTLSTLPFAALSHPACHFSSVILPLHSVKFQMKQ